ncbi:AMP-dependent synthetase/ligase [Treponema bryantii]|uniref:AMP-dependent synthetase/ligase n=1 Tax=Treponema bryantii TaxID=163 RepID=UPI002B2EF83D|nr:long-chain-fatty-acid--CoA ligase [Treponema bryantii]
MAEINNIPWKYLDDFRGSEFKGEWPTFPELLRIQAKRNGERPCFTAFDGPGDSKRTQTYNEVLANVTALADWLIENGLKKGDRVAVMGKNSPEWATAYLAALFASGIVVPVDNGLHEPEVVNIVNTAKPEFVFCDDDKAFYYKNNCPGVKIYSLNPEAGERYVYNLKAKAKPEPNEPATEYDTAAILFTSGTTGKPKGVMLSHRNLISDGFIAQRNFNHYNTDVFYALLPIHHAYTMQAAFINPLQTGASIVFGKSMAVSKLLKELKEGKITVMLGVPLLYNKLLSGIKRGIKSKGPVVAGFLAFVSWLSYMIKKIFHVNPGKRLFKTVLEQASIYTIRVAISGGGPLAASVCRQYNAMGIDFIQGYGLTETSPIIALNPVEHFKSESVGMSFAPYEEIKILNPEKVITKKGVEEVGEIAVKGPMVMQGYYNMPEETKAMFTEDGFLKTGDLGSIDSEGFIKLCGRAKNLIVTSGGKNVYPEEIEDAFQLYDEIQQITVRGYYADDEKTSEEIEALIYPSDDLYKSLGFERNNEFVQDEVLEAVQKIVAKVNKNFQAYSQISKVTLLKEPLEMTTSQKVKRNFVPKTY